MGDAADPLSTVVGGRTFDLLVVGGGINGAAIARDAALRGLSTLLIEAKDWGWGTSAKSSKLAHGGLRYLEQFEFGLVHEALQDRERLLRQAPHLVHPLRFLYPAYPGVAARRTIRAGLWLYDVLSHGKSVPGRGWLARDAALEAAPALRREGLRGAATFYDGQIDQVERLVWEMVLDARNHGAVVRNHARLLRFTTKDGNVTGAMVDDGRGVARIHCRAAVNATGCWVDEALAGIPAPHPLVRTTKGIHVVVPRFLDVALIVKARRDGRTFFILPWQDHCVLGTTDTDYQGDAGDAVASQEEVDYLIAEARRYCPDAPLDQVQYTYAGVRALVNQPGRTESNVTRRHILLDHAAHGAAGLWSLQGGKITTARSLAQDAVDHVQRHLGRPHRDHPTLHALLPGAPNDASVTWAAYATQEAETAQRTWRIPAATAKHLLETYGRRWSEVLACDNRPEALRAVVPTHPHIYAQATFAVRAEQARDLGDVMLRRTSLGLAAEGNPEAAQRVAGWMARLCGWSDLELEAQLATYAREAAHLGVVTSPVPSGQGATAAPARRPASAASYAANVA